MRKMKRINGYLVVRFNDRELREWSGTGLGNYGVIEEESYTGDLDLDRSTMEFDSAETLQEAVDQARGLYVEEDISEPEITVTVTRESDEETIETNSIDPYELFQDEKQQLQELVNNSGDPETEQSIAAAKLYGFRRAFALLGIIDDDDRRFDISHDIFMEFGLPRNKGSRPHYPWNKPIERAYQNSVHRSQHKEITRRLDEWEEFSQMLDQAASPETDNKSEGSAQQIKESFQRMINSELKDCAVILDNSAPPLDWSKFMEIRLLYGDPGPENLTVFINGNEIKDVLEFSITAQEGHFPQYSCKVMPPYPKKYLVQLDRKSETGQ